MSNRVVHFEIAAEDMDAVEVFYRKVFGWEFDKWEDPEGVIRYHLIKTGDSGPGIDGGMMTGDNIEQTIINVIDVADIDETIEAVTRNGGEIVVGKQGVPGVGWAAYFKDPDGHTFGVMEADESVGMEE